MMMQVPGTRSRMQRMLTVLMAHPWIVAALLVTILSYVFAQTRYPALNNDDTYWMGSHYPTIAKGHFWTDGLYFMLFQHNLHANEFRTYGLAKVLHYGLYKIFGAALFPYYLAMALLSAIAALSAASAARAATGSNTVAISLAASCLLGPFMLFQTFHHAVYILLPLCITTIYLALDATRRSGRTRRLAGPVLCVLVVMTGEVARLLLLAALILFAVDALRHRDPVRFRQVSIDLLSALGVLAILYIHYRVAVFNPNLPLRVPTDTLPSWISIWNALYGFNNSIAALITSAGSREIIAGGARFDQPVIAALAGAALAAMVAIFRSSAEPRQGSISPALFALALYAASSVVYVIIAAKIQVSHYPARYLQLAGVCFVAMICLYSAAIPPLPRKMVTSLLVALSAAGGALTFGIKVPTLEGIHAEIAAAVQTEKLRGGKKVVFAAPPGPGGLMNPWRFAPADTPFREWWVMTNYCRMEWSLDCAPGTGEQEGDIVVRSIDHKNGFPPRFVVRTAR